MTAEPAEPGVAPVARREFPCLGDGRPPWLSQSKLRLLWTCLEGRARNRRKLDNLAHLLSCLLGPDPRPRQRLRAAREKGHIDVVPTTAQLWIAARDQIFLKALGDSRELYRRKGIPWTFHHLRRFLAEPTTLMDPIGVYCSVDTIVNHVLQTVHHNPLYDMELLDSRDGGLDELERQLDQLAAGTHLHQDALETLVEEPDYWQHLRVSVREFRRGQRPYPELAEHYDPDRALAIDQFKDMRGYTRYASRLDVSMVDVVVAALQVLFNHSLGALVGKSLGPRTYRRDCCDDDLVAKYLAGDGTSRSTRSTADDP